jgi:hypothetical protein
LNLITTCTPTLLAKAITYHNFLRLGLTVLTVLFAIGLNSCQDPVGIGKSTLQNSDFRDMVLVDTFSIQAHTIRTFDSSAQNTYQYNTSVFCGSYTDKVLGQISARSYFQVLPSTAVALVDGGKLDTIILRLPYVYPAGNKNVSQTFNLFQITNPADSLSRSAKKYVYSNSGYSTSPFAGITFKPNPLSGYLEITTTDTTTPLGRFGQDILNKGSSFVTPSNRNAFVDWFRGFVLAPSDSTLNGSLLGFDLNSSSFNIKYSVNGNKQPLYPLVINSSVPHYSHFGYNLSNTLLNPIINGKELDSISSTQLSNKAYLCPFLGIITRIYIPSLANISKQIGGKIAITKAELILHTTDNDTAIIRYPMPTVMASSVNPGYFTGSKAVEYIANSNSINANVNALTFSLNESDLSTTFPISRYLAGIISGAFPQRGMYVTYRYQYGYTSGYSFFSKAVYDLDNSLQNPNRPRLKLYYVRLN